MSGGYLLFRLITERSPGRGNWRGGSATVGRLLRGPPRLRRRQQGRLKCSLGFLHSLKNFQLQSQPCGDSWAGCFRNPGAKRRTEVAEKHHTRTRVPGAREIKYRTVARRNSKPRSFSFTPFIFPGQCNTAPGRLGPRAAARNNFQSDRNRPID